MNWLPTEVPWEDDYIYLVHHRNPRGAAPTCRCPACKDRREIERLKTELAQNALEEK